MSSNSRFPRSSPSAMRINAFVEDEEAVRSVGLAVARDDAVGRQSASWPLVFSTGLLDGEQIVVVDGDLSAEDQAGRAVPAQA